MPPPSVHDFQDVYVVFPIMDTDLNQVIRSRQSLTEEHCQVFLASIFFLQFLITLINYGPNKLEMNVKFYA